MVTDESGERWRRTEEGGARPINSRVSGLSYTDERGTARVYMISGAARQQ